MKRLLWLAVAVLALSPVVAQSAFGVQEDFETDFPGAPSGVGYTYSQIGGANLGSFRAAADGPGLDGTTNAFLIRTLGGVVVNNGGDGGLFTLTTPHQFSNLTFSGQCWQSLAFGSPATLSAIVNFRDNSSRSVFSLRFTTSNTGSGYRCTVFHSSGECTTSGGVIYYTEAPIANEFKVYAELDWTAKTVDFTIRNGTTSLGSFSESFCNSAATTISNVAVYDPDATSTGLLFDQLQFDGGPATPTVVSPSEFDSGLSSFIIGLGFASPESQFFFSIILIGITTVIGGVLLKWMGPGRLKVILVTIAAALVGVFCVLLAFFDLWMYVLAIVLAGTIIWGAPREARNTWMEIREAIKTTAFKRAGEGEPQPIAGEVLAAKSFQEAINTPLSQEKAALTDVGDDV